MLSYYYFFFLFNVSCLNVPYIIEERPAAKGESARACISLYYIYQGLLGPRDASRRGTSLGNGIAIILELFQTATRVLRSRVCGWTCPPDFEWQTRFWLVNEAIRGRERGDGWHDYIIPILASKNWRFSPWIEWSLKICQQTLSLSSHLNN